MNTHEARRFRIWTELALATVSAVTFVLTLVAQDWLERMTGVSPDQGSGEVEWLLSGGTLAATLALATIASLEWRRVRTG